MVNRTHNGTSPTISTDAHVSGQTGSLQIHYTAVNTTLLIQSILYLLIIVKVGYSL